MKQITKEFMTENCGCYSQEKLMNCSFMKKEGDIITLHQIFESEIPLKDKFWFFCKKVATKKENQKMAIEVAEIVLTIYEKKHPNDLRPRQAIESARLYIEGNITLEELIEKRWAAYAAAADAAVAAYAAADAAAYADAYADAAYAAAAVAAAAADAADDIEIRKKLQNYLFNLLCD